MIYYSNTQFPSDRMAFIEAHKELRHSHVFLRCIKRSPGGVYVWFMLDVTSNASLSQTMTHYIPKRLS